MYSSKIIGRPVAYGLLYTCALGFFGTALAASDTAESQPTAQSQRTEAQQLAEELKRYNNNFKSNDTNSSMDKRESANADALAERIRRFNASGGSLKRKPVDTESGQAGPSNPTNKMDEQLSREINRFNRNRGSLKEESSARTGVDQ